MEKTRTTADPGLIHLTSNQSVDDIVRRLLELLQEKHVKVFAVIDHSGEAEAAGLHMPNTKLVIFGNPRAGTPLMLAKPEIAFDLPLKILIAEAEDHATQITYEAPEHLAIRHSLDATDVANLTVIESIASTIAASAK